MSSLRIAIVHDWLVSMGGAEKVLEELLRCYPDADLFILLDQLTGKDRSFLDRRVVTTSFINRLPFIASHYRKLLPLMPFVIEQFDLSRYDIVISSSHAVAKGVITGPDQMHISYCYSPMRYAWDMWHEYLETSGLKRSRSFVARWFLHRIRLWDVCAANRVDRFVAISRFIKRRIEKTYRRDATVIYPPVDVDVFSIRGQKEGFYLTVSRLVPYKRIDLIVEAFSAMKDKELVVIGDGPDAARIKARAGRNIKLLGWVDRTVLIDYMQRARAFVFAAQEDFGIAPVEAQACGTPVIAFGKGGVRETVIGLDSPNPTGVFFDVQDAGAIRDAVRIFEREAGRITPAACRANAMRFSSGRFRREFTAFVDNALADFKGCLSI
ncbi:MAG: glycosyltransferase family 4 protein [Dissulfurimicrobium sp.]|uniref:glycosyltransferase family 4 protein n=1 Tax=Dissulfurimicrobium sp. TaxID=2022436 RepID=UPI00404B9842